MPLCFRCEFYEEYSKSFGSGSNSMKIKMITRLCHKRNIQFKSINEMPLEPDDCPDFQKK
jgi:hypothetical protein